MNMATFPNSHSPSRTTDSSNYLLKQITGPDREERYFNTLMVKGLYKHLVCRSSPNSFESIMAAHVKMVELYLGQSNH